MNSGRICVFEEDGVGCSKCFKHLVKDTFAVCAVCPFPAGVQLKLRINQPARQKCPCRCVWGFFIIIPWVLCRILWVSMAKRIIPFGFEVTCKGQVLRVWGKGQKPCREAICTDCYIHEYEQIWHSEEQEGLILLSETNCILPRLLSFPL